jgi:hypothetical protein
MFKPGWLAEREYAMVEFVPGTIGVRRYVVEIFCCQQALAAGFQWRIVDMSHGAPPG